MAPKFLVRKNDKKDGAESDLSAAEDSSNECLTADIGQGKKRRRSFLDRIPSSLNVSTDNLVNDGENTTPRNALNEKTSNGFLSTVNNMLRSPRSAVTDSSNSLQLPVGRPRARTAPSTPCNEAVKIQPTLLAELPAHVPAREEEITPQSIDVLSTVEKPEDQEQSRLWASSWFRRPQEVVKDDLDKTPTMPTPASENGEDNRETEISPMNQTEEPGTPQNQITPALESQPVRDLKSAGTVELPVHPALREKTQPAQQPPQRPHAASFGPVPPPGRPFIPMPSWPVSGPPNALLGPIPPGAGPAPPAYAQFPRVPFFNPPRSNSVPNPPLATQSTPPPPPSQAQLHTPPPSASRPAPPKSPNAELASLRQSHASYIASLNNAHERELTSLRQEIAAITQATSTEISAQSREIASLRTHIALLEHQASLRPGQHLSPSGLLPPLNTSPEAILAQHIPSHQHHSTSSPSQTSHHSRPSITHSHPSPSPSPRSPSLNADLSLELANLQTALARRNTDLSTSTSQLATVTHQLRETQSRLATTLQSLDDARQSLALKDKKESQITAAVARGVKKESALKVKVREVEGRLEQANTERVDLREALGEFASRCREKEAAMGKFREEVEALKGEVGAMKARREKEEGEKGARVGELEKVLAETMGRLSGERDQVGSLRRELEGERKEVGTLRERLVEVEKERARLEKEREKSSVEQMGMITIANALGGEYGGISPVGPTSVVGRLHLLRGEVRNLEPEEREKLAEELRRLEGGEKVYVDGGSQTERSAEEKREKEREKAQRAIMRKLEAERDQLSGLLSTEIRRTARQSAKGDDGFQGLSRLERWDSVSSRMSTIRSKPSSLSLNSAEMAKHAACEEALDKARQGYEDEIKGLVKEIVLYKLDIKGYKKDLRKANTALKMLKQVSTPTSAEDREVPDSAKVEPLILRSRASTTNLVKEKVKETDRPAFGRTQSVDGLGITFGDDKSKIADTTIKPEEDVRLGRKDSGLGKDQEKQEQSKDGRSVEGSSTGGLTPELRTGDLSRAATQRSVAQSIITSYGKDRNSVLPDALLDEDELRPLSTVAEVGSA
ncbi:hypothetical protein KVT40_007914 [Elsinoe batatas]|uniref:Uncharacterized protein n=1 Tax=Elsinoe batatas TaxID=2601811 RepID=A0A8K0KWY3_9PEZI|nr:hypothetical protein KVT40_007914 [Elsinoe batatas]